MRDKNIYEVGVLVGQIDSLLLRLDLNDGKQKTVGEGLLGIKNKLIEVVVNETGEDI